jgi:hypothetical protein
MLQIRDRLFVSFKLGYFDLELGLALVELGNLPLDRREVVLDEAEGLEVLQDI